MSRSPLRPGFTVLEKHGPGSLGGNDCWWGSGRVFVKPNQANHKYLVANEYLCARLAAAVGIPVPAGEIAEGLSDGTVWVSTVVDLDGETVAPDDPAEVAVRDPDLSAGIFVFDVWVLNTDRNDENLVAHPKLGLWAIDHDDALGDRSTGESGTLDRVKNAVLDTHVFQRCPLAPRHLQAWGERIQHVPVSAIKRLTKAGYRAGLYSKDISDEIADFLLHRQGDIHRLVKRSRPPAAKPGDASKGGEDQ